MFVAVKLAKSSAISNEWLSILSSTLERIGVTEQTSLEDSRINYVPESCSSTPYIIRLLLRSCDSLGLAVCCLIMIPCFKLPQRQRISGY